MPELPEVEVMVRHLRPLLQNRAIHEVLIQRAKLLAPTPPTTFTETLRGAKFAGLSRRGKHLLFHLRRRDRPQPLMLVGHLGMTGRMYLQPATQPLPKHAAVVLNLGRDNFVFEDTRYFGRLTLETSVVDKLGPEPLSGGFTPLTFGNCLKRSSQPIKIKLLDQSLVAGIGNIYASEALFRAGISPRLPARRLTLAQVRRLWKAIRQVLREAIAGGSTVPLNFSGDGTRDGLFYFGSAPGAAGYYEERLQVYDRAGQPCSKCRAPIKRVVQAARSTFYCTRCQRG